MPSSVSLLGPAVGQNMLEHENPHVVEVVGSLIEKSQAGGGFVRYRMPRLEGQKAAPKVSYVLGVPAWGWYIGAGVYVDEIEATIRARQGELGVKRCCV
jgi:signal transduction histidine kinase